MPERRFKGHAATPGLAIGPLIRLDDDRRSTDRRQGKPAEEKTALEEAIGKAAADLEALAAVASGDGAAILAFQIEMLDDPALTETVWTEIEAGKEATQAWIVGLDAEIEGYKLADDDYFRARASDLDDLKDRVARALAGGSSVLPNMPAGAIVIARDLPPSRFLALERKTLGGIALIEGNTTSHVAILARARGLPMIVGLDPDIVKVVGGKAEVNGILNADEACLIASPDTTTAKRYRAKQEMQLQAAKRAASLRDQPSVTVDGQTVSVLINLDDPAAVDETILAAADGVGLLRTEFLLLGRRDLPSEDEHFQIYADLQKRLGGRQLVIRTLDIGGDKPLPSLDLPEEQNPFLGLRGIRLCLDRPTLFRPQARALLRTAAKGPLDVMLPMVAVQVEIDETRAFFADCLADLQREGVEAIMPNLGVMVETPAAALAVDKLDAAFFSIGSNDLIQYTMAAARDGTGRVAALLDPGHIAIERLLETVIEQGRATGKEVSLCGDMASDPATLPLVLRAGLRKISVSAGAFDQVKVAISTIDLRPGVRYLRT